MFVELIEHLRCPRDHAQSPLVAAAARTEARHIVEGILGCPVCGAEFPIVDGTATFDDAPHGADVPASPTDAVRVAALLGLSDARGFAVLYGGRGAHAGDVAAAAPTPLVLVNAPAGAAVHEVAGRIRVSGALPFADDVVRAIALDGTASPATIASAARVLRAGGRLVAPVSIPVPEGVAEMARDDRDWVGEKAAASGGTPRLVPLTRAER